MDKIWPKVEEIDKKFNKSILAKPLSFISKKINEQAGKELIRGNFKALSEAVRSYSLILIIAWLITWSLIWAVLGFLAQWIIGTYVWKEPLLSEQELE